jgi:hypothetical protein
MKKTVLTVTVILLGVFAGPVSTSAQAPAFPISPERAGSLTKTDQLQREIDRINRLELWVENYRDLGLYVVFDNLDDDKKQLVIPREVLEARVEARLRQAHIRPIPYHQGVDPTLIVIVRVVGGAFSIQVGFYRNVVWTLPNGQTTGWPLDTWHEDVVGTHGNNRVSVLSKIDDVVNKFLNDYLKANQEQ